MPTDPEPVTLATVVHRAVVAVDPKGHAGIEDLLERFEDDDEPLGNYRAEIAAQRIAEEARKLDPQAEDPAVQLAAAVATYLAFRRDEMDEEPGELLALAARAEFEGNPPDHVRALLAERGVEL
jgi:ubiquinone biosynthesis protein UbiJ